jgi:RimJ/RimL family protein N-acetyltransferase
MDYGSFIKRLGLPDGWAAPMVLEHGDLRAEAITRDHLHDDVAGINASLEIIRRTRGGGWPTEPVTDDGNYVDLVWHECEFRDGGSYTYAVYDVGGTYLGCCYLYPMGRRTRLTAELLDHDVDVSWWVTPEAYERGLYATLHTALRHWATADFPFTSPYFSNREIPPAS